MTYDEFITEYHNVAALAVQLSETARKDGILAMEDIIHPEKVKQRDILEYGIQLVVDGFDSELLGKILSNIITQEDDKYTRQLMLIKKKAVLMIQAGDNPRIIAPALNSFTDIPLPNDPILQKTIKEGDRGRLSLDEINVLTGGIQ